MSDTYSILGGASIFSNDQMAIVFFLYGLSFLILGTVVFLKKTRIRDVDLTRSFYYLGAFGITHGIAEWIDLARIEVKIAGAAPIPALDGAKIFFMAISFLFLLQFGINILTMRRKHLAALRWLPLTAGIIFLAVTFATGTFLGSELAARYAFGFSGALATTLALLEVRNAASSDALREVRDGSTIMAAAFGAYAVFGGLVTTPILGIPPPIRAHALRAPGGIRVAWLALGAGSGIGEKEQGQMRG